jgi:hypothetical protein
MVQMYKKPLSHPNHRNSKYHLADYQTEKCFI